MKTAGEWWNEMQEIRKHASLSNGPAWCDFIERIQADAAPKAVGAREWRNDCIILLQNIRYLEDIAEKLDDDDAIIVNQIEADLAATEKPFLNAFGESTNEEPFGDLPGSATSLYEELLPLIMAGDDGRALKGKALSAIQSFAHTARAQGFAEGCEAAAKCVEKTAPLFIEMRGVLSENPEIIARQEAVTKACKAVKENLAFNIRALSPAPRHADGMVLVPRTFLESIIDNNPDGQIADNGMTMWDGLQNHAKKLLEGTPDAGLVLVPKILTRAMMDTAGAIDDGPGISYQEHWDAMLRAAGNKSPLDNA